MSIISLNSEDLQNKSKDELIAMMMKISEQKTIKEASIERMKNMLKKWDGLDLNLLSREEQIAYSLAVKDAQSTTDWNNEARKSHRPPVAKAPKIVKRPPIIDGVRYDSHAELRVMEGPLKKLPACRVKLPYVQNHSYEVDGWFPSTNLIIEVKPIIENKLQCRKFLEVIKQNQVGILFIFREPGLSLFWNKERKDGSVITQEEWCEFHKSKGVPIYYTFEDELDTYIRTKEFKEIYDKHYVKEGFELAGVKTG